MKQPLTVDGVPVIHAARPGSTTANLMFRVGHADEALSQRGITHLVEHLALFPLGIRDHHSNGETGLHVTNFHATGTPSEVTSFLAALCDGLTDLPMARLDAEKSVLRTEASQRPGWSFADLAIWRHGAKNDGAAAYPEWGLAGADPAALDRWRDDYFTADNCVLVVVGPDVPENLRLPLPRGQRRPVPAIDRITPRGAWTFSAGQGQLMFDAVVERSTTAAILAELLSRMMFQDLRLDAAYSYTAGCGYEPRDATHAVIRGYADTLDEQVEPAIGTLMDLLARVRGGHVEDAVVTELVAKRLEAMESPDAPAAMIAASGFDQLVGAEPLSPEDYRALLRAVTPDQVRRLATTVFDDMLLQLPIGHTADWAGFDPLDIWSSRRVAATATYRLLDDTGALHSAPDGVSMVTPDGILTVQYASCAACLAWPDGRRVLVGDDGIAVTIEPNLLQSGRTAVQIVDQSVAAHRVIAQPERTPEDIPAAPAAPPTPASGGLFRRRRR